MKRYAPYYHTPLTIIDHYHRSPSSSSCIILIMHHHHHYHHHHPLHHPHHHLSRPTRVVWTTPSDSPLHAPSMQCPMSMTTAAVECLSLPSSWSMWSTRCIWSPTMILIIILSMGMSIGSLTSSCCRMTLRGSYSNRTSRE